MLLSTVFDFVCCFWTGKFHFKGSFSFDVSLLRFVFHSFPILFLNLSFWLQWLIDASAVRSHPIFVGTWPLNGQLMAQGCSNGGGLRRRSDGLGCLVGFGGIPMEDCPFISSNGPGHSDNLFFCGGSLMADVVGNIDGGLFRGEATDLF